MATYEELHAGAVVVGYDGNAWGVEAITFVPHLSVTLVRHDQRVTGFPPPGTEVAVVDAPDVTAEGAAWSALAGADLSPELISEHWER